MAKRPAKRARVTLTDTWQRLPGSGKRERYIPPRGLRLPRGTRVEYAYVSGRRVRTVSRRQYENARARVGGYQSLSEFRRLTGRKDRVIWDYSALVRRQKLSSRYEAFLRIASEELGIPKRELRRPDSKFNQLWRRAVIDDWGEDYDGPYSDLLQYIGLRRKDTMMPVGSGDTGYGEFKKS